MRIFVDANVLFTAAYTPGGPSNLLVRFGHGRSLTLVTCDYVVGEVERNLARKAPPAAMERLPALVAACEPVPTILNGDVPPGLPAKDHPIWLSAVAAGCNVLLTGDRKDFGRLKHPKMVVMGPSELFEELWG